MAGVNLRRPSPGRRASAGALVVRAAFALLLCACAAHRAPGQHVHDPRHNDRSAPRAPTARRSAAATAAGGRLIKVGGTTLTIPDAPLRDQNGRGVRLYTDLIKDKVVVVSFFFTGCTFTCPMQGVTMKKLQPLLGERMGKEVFFISISKDPKNDTPKRLKEWARNFGVGSGWTLLTGDERVLQKLVWEFIGENLGQATHLPLLLIGNDKTGVWVGTDGGLPAADLVKVIDRITRPPEQ